MHERCIINKNLYSSFIFSNHYRPDTQSYIDKMKKEEAEKAKGQQGDNRSFIAKYVSQIIVL